MAAAPSPPPALVHATERTLGRATVSRSRPTAGLSAAHRFVVALADGTYVFVKAAVDDETEAWLWRERLVITDPRTADDLARGTERQPRN